jgi:hypothetical protein
MISRSQIPSIVIRSPLILGTLVGMMLPNCSDSRAERRSAPAPGSLPVVRRVLPSRATVPRYERVELTVDLEARYANPFDPEQVALEARFRAPSGVERIVPGFWYRPYRRQLHGTRELLTPAGNGGWRIRFAPEEIGRYTYAVTVRDTRGTSAPMPGAFASRASKHPGYVRVSRADRRFFAFDSGKPYFPIGANVCWSGGGAPAHSRGTFDYDDWFPRYAAQGCNYARLWIGPFDLFTLERHAPGDKSLALGRYDLAGAWRIDTVLERAEATGLYLMFCLESFNSLRIRQSHAMWDRNPYNAANGGPLRRPEQFFTDARARRLFLRKLRYMVARWGYSTHLLAWEFWNEVDLIETYRPTEVREWHIAMSHALRDLDPWDHLQTTSFATPHGEPSIDSLQEIDFVQTHHYGSRDMAADLPEYCRRKIREYGKPHFIGEFGADAGGPRDDDDPTGIHLHNGLWSSVMSLASGAAMLWWWDSYIDPKNLYPHFGALARFLKGVDWPRAGLRPLEGIELSYRHRPASHGYRERTISPRRGSWNPAPFNRPNEFTIDREGEVANETNLARILHGTQNHPDLHNPATFQVDYPVPGQFVVCVEGVSGHGGAALEIWCDGDRVLAKEFADPDGKGKTDTLRCYAGEYAIDVPEGRHTIRVVNPGSDWIEVGYRLTNYVQSSRPPLRILGLRGTELTLLWAQNLEHTWYLRSRGRPLVPVDPATLILPGFTAGVYEVELWDPYAGKMLRRESTRVANGRVVIWLPEIARDVALKVRVRP